MRSIQVISETDSSQVEIEKRHTPNGSNEGQLWCMSRRLEGIVVQRQRSSMVEPNAALLIMTGTGLDERHDAQYSDHGMWMASAS